MRASRLVVALGVFATAAVTSFSHARAEPSTRLPRVDAPGMWCGTARADVAPSLRAASATTVPDGTPLSFDQDPPLVAADFDGVITFRNLEIVGDVSAIQFRRPVAAPGGDIVETWPRVGSRSVDGRLVSIFEPRWGGAQLAGALSLWVWGFDNPGLYWGAIEVPGTSYSRPVYLRMALGGIPASRVVRVNTRVQYASNVVNLVVPGFGDGRVTGGSKAFELDDVSHAFYSYFADRYDVMAIIPQSAPLAEYGAFHHVVQNRVTGLNMPLVDETARYGSVGVLQGLEVYAGVAGAVYEQTNHEMAHQWGSSFDWTRIAGIVRAGHEPSIHAPLWTGGETLVGAVLNGSRRVRAAGAWSNPASPEWLAYEIERTPAPARFHPLELYSMGVIAAGQVPDFGVLVDQQQFDGLALMPTAGTTLRGSARRVGIGDIVREHGIRSGPSPTVWRRATVLVTRDRLATQQEMDYWNFFAQRLGGGPAADAPTVSGYVPFREATNNLISLSTALQPLGAEALPESLDPARTPFGPRDWRGVVFSTDIPRRFHAGTAVTVSGRVTDELDEDIDRVEVVFWREGANSIAFAGPVTRLGDFDLPMRFSDDQRGPYIASLYLLPRGAAGHYPRGSLTTVTVE